MIRIWAYTTVESKITKSFIYESIDNFSSEKFRFHIEKICHDIDIPTPIILKSHIENYENFNTTTFAVRDFIESVDFEKFIIENATLSE